MPVQESQNESRLADVHAKIFLALRFHYVERFTPQWLKRSHTEYVFVSVPLHHFNRFG